MKLLTLGCRYSVFVMDIELLAHALGGEVACNPVGRESGTIQLELHPAAFDDPLFANLPRHFFGTCHSCADGIACA